MDIYTIIQTGGMHHGRYHFQRIAGDDTPGSFLVIIEQDIPKKMDYLMLGIIVLRG